ncbi:hypothetical protein E1B28_002630 [Marasmius oreades]|uniref:Uncharacterized protein n=1 Tax=Marasmius oreades TaxID=181124 RepID=A0A9P7RNR9_9AGAR|nr:uncharacterized protein E1B28_002630 [Marasmius oreades]KAG7086692.1 hypothetical protein E1B28_002630 [Marasmius oreades]
MTRTIYHLQDASMTFTIRAMRISTSDRTRAINVATVAAKAPTQHDANRMPLVEHCFERWPIPQPYVHNCEVVYKGTRFRVLFQRHKRLPRNGCLSIQGDIIVMRLGIQNPSNVINLRKGDHRKARIVATKFEFCFSELYRHSQSFKLGLRLILPGSKPVVDAS